MAQFADDIAQAGYSATKGLFRIKWKEPVNYELLRKMIEFNIQDKAEYTDFWREKYITPYQKTYDTKKCHAFFPFDKVQQLKGSIFRTSVERLL